MCQQIDRKKGDAILCKRKNESNKIRFLKETKMIVASQLQDREDRDRNPQSITIQSLNW